MRRSIAMRKALAFIIRDFREETSYKMYFLQQLAGILMPLITFFFISRLFQGAIVAYLRPYGGSLFAFIVIGLAFFRYFGLSVRGLSEKIRSAQSFGTLEALLVTQTDIPTILIASTLYGYIVATIQAALYLGMGTLFFGLNLTNANVFGALLIFGLSLLSFWCIGVLSGSFVMVLKRGDPVTWLFTSASIVFGGLYFPVSVFPDWLRTFSYLLPVTYSLEGLRLALLTGATLPDLVPYLLILLLFAALLLPVSLFVFSASVRKAKKDGTLSQD
jgi:ABC-2 type transport system permease protein